MPTFTALLLVLTSIFLILVILVQRGRGGGLVGALGGQGGHSAFGTKAGDLFTLITVITAVVWVGLACATGYAIHSDAAWYARQGTSAKTTGTELDTKPGKTAADGKSDAS